MKHGSIYGGVCNCDKESKVKFFYSQKRTFKIKIECQNLKSYHKHTHKLLGKIICSTLGIDNRGNIEVFYVLSARQSLVAYLQISNANIDGSKASNSMSLFSRFVQIGNDKESISESFKLSLNEYLRLNVEAANGSNMLAPGEVENVIGDKIKITIEEQKSGLSVDPGAVATIDVKTATTTRTNKFKVREIGAKSMIEQMNSLSSNDASD